MVSKARIIDCTNHAFEWEQEVELDWSNDEWFYFKDEDGLGQYLFAYQFEWIEEDEDMRKSNPKSFRNGDIIKIEYGGNSPEVYVKFGENYYNLSGGGQMKAYKYLPRGRKEVITNLSGLGEFFLMDPEELRKQFAPEEKEEGQAEIPFSGPVASPKSFTPDDWVKLIEEMEKRKDTDISVGSSSPSNDIKFVTYGVDYSTEDYTITFSDNNVS